MLRLRLSSTWALIEGNCLGTSLARGMMRKKPLITCYDAGRDGGRREVWLPFKTVEEGVQRISIM